MRPFRNPPKSSEFLINVPKTRDCAGGHAMSPRRRSGARCGLYERFFDCGDAQGAPVQGATGTARAGGRTIEVVTREDHVRGPEGARRLTWRPVIIARSRAAFRHVLFRTGRQG